MKPFHFDRSWRFEVPVDELWSALQRTHDYPRWWPWLRRFDAGPLAPGTRASFTVQPPLPYALRFVVVLEDVVDRERVQARVSGDVRGEAVLAVAPTADGSRVHLIWDLVLERRSLARVERIMRPLMVWGHDVIVGLGVRQFRRRALRPLAGPER